MSIPRNVQLKLARSEEHLRLLDSAIEQFLEAEPYAARRVVQQNGSEHVVIWDRYTEAPDRFGLMAGDAIHNLRSSLDHMVVALAKAGAEAAGISMTEAEETRLQFQIITSHQDFVNQLSGSRLRYVEPNAQALIESRQPYNVKPDAPRQAALCRIRDLDNADKHRVLTVAGLSTNVMRINWPAELRNYQIQRPLTTTRPEAGTEIGRFIFPSPQSESDVPIEFEWGFTLWTGYWSFIDIVATIRGYISVVISVLSVLSETLP